MSWVYAQAHTQLKQMLKQKLKQRLKQMLTAGSIYTLVLPFSPSGKLDLDKLSEAVLTTNMSYVPLAS